MKVLIGYDGSEGADAALEELKRAALPAETEILVVTAGEVWLPPNIEMYQFAFASRRAAAAAAQLKDQAGQLLKLGEELMEKAVAQIRSDFPDWRVESEILSGEAASVLIGKAADWKADLIIVGSRNRSVVGRFFLGSVSLAVVAGAPCAVRVARGRELANNVAAPHRIVAGIDESASAEALIETLARRRWAKESVALLVTAAAAADTAGTLWVKQMIEAQEIQQSAKEKLASTGLKILTSIKEGEAKDVLLAAADTLSADCIFVGARNFERLFNVFNSGGVSEAMVTDAPCAVEGVRDRAS